MIALPCKQIYNAMEPEVMTIILFSMYAVCVILSFEHENDEQKIAVIFIFLFIIFFIIFFF